MIRLMSGVAIAALLAAAAAPPQDGRAIYTGKGNCFACHGPAGRGTPVGPDLTDDVWLNISGTRDEIASLVRTGVATPKRHPAPMPPMGGGRLSDAEVEAVAAYVFGLRQEP